MVRYIRINDEEIDEHASSKKHFGEFLQLRFNTNVHEICFDFSRARSDIDIFRMLMKYASSRGLLKLWVCGSNDFEDYCGPSDTVFRSIALCGGTLDDLELEEFKFGVLMTFGRSCSKFTNLTTLTLTNSYLDFSDRKRLDPFAHFPALKHLKLNSCSRHMDSADDHTVTGILEINGKDQLLTLEMSNIFGFTGIRVSASNLTSFTFIHQYPLTKVFLNAESLETADITFLGYENLDEFDQQMSHIRYANLLRGLIHAKSLAFQFEVTMAFYRACDLMRDEPSPFGRLESFTLRPQKGGGPPIGVEPIPDYVKRYFFGNNPPEPVHDEEGTKMIRPALGD